MCLTTFPKKSMKNTLLCVIFSTLFAVFRNVVKNGLLCLIYYIHINRMLVINGENGEPDQVILVHALVRVTVLFSRARHCSLIN